MSEADHQKAHHHDDDQHLQQGEAGLPSAPAPSRGTVHPPLPELPRRNVFRVTERSPARPGQEIATSTSNSVMAAEETPSWLGGLPLRHRPDAQCPAIPPAIISGELAFGQGGIAADRGEVRLSTLNRFFDPRRRIHSKQPARSGAKQADERQARDRQRDHDFEQCEAVAPRPPISGSRQCLFSRSASRPRPPFAAARRRARSCRRSSCHRG